MIIMLTKAWSGADLNPLAYLRAPIMAPDMNPTVSGSTVVSPIEYANASIWEEMAIKSLIPI